MSEIFDLERMKKALSSESIKIPKGLSREEIRQFILKHGKSENKS